VHACVALFVRLWLCVGECGCVPARVCVVWLCAFMCVLCCVWECRCVPPCVRCVLGCGCVPACQCVSACMFCFLWD
jgi:hypothetical protein